MHAAAIAARRALARRAHTVAHHREGTSRHEFTLPCFVSKTVRIFFVPILYFMCILREDRRERVIKKIHL